MISSNLKSNGDGDSKGKFLRFHWQISISILAAALSIMINSGCWSKPAEPPVVTEPRNDQTRVEIGSIDLQIVLSDRERVQASLPCFEDSTVLSILEDARQIGLLSFKSRGSGETAFLESIQGLSNAGSGGDNWVYRVNDQLGDKSCGVYPVAPDDKILWSFGKVSFNEDESE